MADIINDKRVILSNPGSQRSDVYYTKQNTTVDNVETTYNTGRFKQSLSNVSLGGQALITVPNSSFLGECYLHLKLPALVAEQSLCRGWGYGVINTISYIWGSANVSQITMDGQSVFQTVMAQCVSEEKRSELFRLAGEELFSPGDSGVSPSATIMLPLPWSTACGGTFSKKPFDTNLLNSPITITISFKNADSIYGGAGARPVSFAQTDAVFRQGNLSNKNNSLKLTLMSNPGLMLAYPFIHHQSFQTGRLTASAPSDEISTVLQSFINADLVAITFGCIKTSNITPSANNSCNPFIYEELDDVRLLFNGEVIYDAPGDMYKMINAQSITGAGFVQTSEVTGAAEPFTSTGRDTYMVIVDMSRIRSVCYEGEYQNVLRYPNQVLELRFKLPAADPAENYRVHATYHYSGVAEIQSGMTEIHFT